MPIMGINLEKCSNCKQCMRDCVARNFSLDETRQQIIFDSSRRCISCGHCIAVCPENAIEYEHMGDEPLDFKLNRDPNELISYDVMLEFLHIKRSIRQYKHKKVPKEIIEKVINSMSYAPTGANMRNLKCLVLSDEVKIKLLSDSIVDAIISGEDDRRLTRMRDEGMDPIFYKAPHVLIIYSKNPWDTRNSTIVITYAMLSAQTLGLGSCWIGYAHGILMERSEIRTKYTGIQTYVLGVMILGYPSVKYYRSVPRPLLEVKGIFD